MEDCDTFCTEAQTRGFATIALQGIGGESDELPSWNGFGSTNSSTEYLKEVYDWTGVSSGCDESAQDAETGRTCNVDPYATTCTDDCKDGCLDECWWTTCQDSVGQVLTVLSYFTQQFCIDETMIWATGCSNGGMFLYELANDERSSSLFAGVAPMVGLPHYGFNFGPKQNMSFFGSWGLSDETVPPEENPSQLGCSLPCRTSESDGWFYTSSECTTKKWADVLALDNYQDVGDFGYSDNQFCWSYSSSSTTAIEVVGCHFDGDHSGCNMEFQMSPMLDFMESHPKRDIETPVPTNPPSGLASTLEPSSTVIEGNTGSPLSSMAPSPEPSEVAITLEPTTTRPSTYIVSSETTKPSSSQLPTIFDLGPSTMTSSMVPTSEQLGSNSTLEPSTLSSMAPSPEQSTLGPLTARPSADLVSSDTTNQSSSLLPTLFGEHHHWLVFLRPNLFFCECINNNLLLHSPRLCQMNQMQQTPFQLLQQRRESCLLGIHFCF